MSRFFTSVTAIVVPYYMARIRSFLFTCVILNNVIPYGYIYVDSSYSSLSGGLLSLCHEDRCPVGRKAWGLVGSRSRAFRSWWQEGVARCVILPYVQDSVYIFCLENPFIMLRFSTSVTDIVFPYYMARMRSF